MPRCPPRTSRSAQGAQPRAAPRPASPGASAPPPTRTAPGRRGPRPWRQRQVRVQAAPTTARARTGRPRRRSAAPTRPPPRPGPTRGPRGRRSMLTMTSSANAHQPSVGDVRRVGKADQSEHVPGDLTEQPGAGGQRPQRPAGPVLGQRAGAGAEHSQQRGERRGRPRQVEAHASRHPEVLRHHGSERNEDGGRRRPRQAAIDWPPRLHRPVIGRWPGKDEFCGGYPTADRPPPGAPGGQPAEVKRAKLCQRGTPPSPGDALRNIGLSDHKADFPD